MDADIVMADASGPVAPATREAIVAARHRDISRPSFPGLQTRIRREDLTSIGTSIHQIIVREDWPNTYRDEDEEPDPGRLMVRRLVEEEEPDNELVAMATIELSGDGRSLRTFTGKGSSEQSIMCCPKSHHLLHVEGATAESFVTSQQVAHETTTISSEGMRIRWDGGAHNPDAVLYREHGGFVVREIKRDENDLRDPRTRRNIAIGSEILRRSGIDYRIVFRREIFTSPRHRKNASLFASRGFAHVSRRQLDALDDRLEARGPQTTWGELVALLDRRDRIGAVASAQALVVRRRVEIDLTGRVHDDLPVTLHPAPTTH